jgi:hypothetical protein
MLCDVYDWTWRSRFGCSHYSISKFPGRAWEQRVIGLEELMVDVLALERKRVWARERQGGL